VRQKLRRAITKNFIPNGEARVITISPDAEKAVMASLRQTDQGVHAALEPAQVHKLLGGIKKAAESAMNLGITPIMITSPQIRRQIKSLSMQVCPDLVVLSYNELEQDVKITSDWVVSV